MYKSHNGIARQGDAIAMLCDAPLVVLRLLSDSDSDSDGPTDRVRNVVVLVLEGVARSGRAGRREDDGG